MALGRHFRDWAGDRTTFPRQIAEAALAHTAGGVEAAYRRGDALEAPQTHGNTGIILRTEK
jgi:hypothetical protein